MRANIPLMSLIRCWFRTADLLLLSECSGLVHCLEHLHFHHSLDGGGLGGIGAHVLLMGLGFDFVTGLSFLDHRV